MINIEYYLNNFFKGTKEPSLDSMKYFMNEYNNFQSQMKFIHIAGTNGKGSCVETISNILEKQGYKVGKFLSPHLIKYNERISINGKEISDLELTDLIEELKPKIENYNSDKREVSLFELITIIALLHFYRNKVDFVVLETGLGGTYDSTNIITKPLVSIITSIGYDHMHILGDTLQKIACEKAGIIKENSSTVFWKQSQEIDNIFINACKEKNNMLHLIEEKDVKNYKYDDKYQYFDYKDLKNIEIILKGKKQIQNACICIECMNVLNSLGYEITEENIRKGLKTVIHRGRMETLHRSPLIIYDGAHNEPAIENLKTTVDMYYKGFKRVYIVSILKRKDYKKMLQLLLEDENAEFIFTSGNDAGRYVSSEELYNLALGYRKNQTMYKKTLDEAIEYAMQECNDKVNLVVGSFYIYGNVVDKISTME